MNISKQLAATLLAGVLMAIGCSQGASPIAPPEINACLPAVSSQSANHQLLGLYTFTCDATTGTVDAIPLRGTQLHLNALKFLEPPPLVKLTIEGKPKFVGNMLDVDIGLRNPYLALTEYTGFDVCGIVFTHGSLTGFTDPDIVMAGEGDTRLLNADGYTRWWNPREFTHGDTIFNYIDGLLGTPAENADFNCTINGYKYFANSLGKNDPLTALDPAKRGVFSAGGKNIRHYKLDLSGGLTFNYAVDACWKKPTGKPPYKVPDDFPPEANKPEAWNVNITELENTLYSVDKTYIRGGSLKIQINVFDHFDAGLNEVYAESLTGLPLASALTPVGGGDGYSIYELEFTGKNLVRSGIADLLITVQSEAVDYGGLLPGKPISNYFKWAFSINPNPPPGWVVTWGGDYIGEDSCEDMALDDAGNIYVTGWVKNEDGIPVLDFDPGPGEDVFTGYATDSYHSYIAKFSWNGVYQWSRVWGEYEDVPHQDVNSTGICIDSHGNLFVVGRFEGNVDFDPGPGVELHSNKAFFLSKFDSDGLFQWVITLDEGSYGEGYTVAVDSFDNVYAGGRFTNQADLDPGPGVDMHTANFGQDIFISKFDNNGNFQWARTWGGVSTIGEHETIDGIAIDDYNNVWATGRFYFSVDFDPGPEKWILTSNGGAFCDVYLTKFNANGDFQFAVSWGGVDRDLAYGIASGIGGDVYVVGACSSGVDFDPGPGIDDEHMAGGSFLSKFDQQGIFQWVRIHYKSHLDVTADNNGNIYCVGDLPHDGSHLIKYNQMGDMLWLREWSGTPKNYVGCYCVAVNLAGDIYTGGEFMYTVDFNPGPGVDEHTSNGNCYDAYDAYLSKFPPDGNW